MPFAAVGVADDRFQVLRAEFERYLRDRDVPDRRKRLPTDSKTVADVLAANKDPRCVLWAFPDVDPVFDNWRIGKPDDVLGEVHLAATGLWVLDALEDPRRIQHEWGDLREFLGIVRTHLLFPDRYAEVQHAQQAGHARRADHRPGEPREPHNKALARAARMLPKRHWTNIKLVLRELDDDWEKYTARTAISHVDVDADSKLVTFVYDDDRDVTLDENAIRQVLMRITTANG